MTETYSFKTQYRNDRITSPRVSSNLTHKDDKRVRSICKAKGATWQILVANALKYSFFFVCKSVLYLKSQACRSHSRIGGKLSLKFLGKWLLNEKYTYWTSLANIYQDNFWHKHLFMSCLGIFLSKLSQFLKNAGFLFCQHILKSKSGYQESCSLIPILEFVFFLMVGHRVV